MTMIEKIGRNYIEQLHTTLETMRRRGIELYDHGEHMASGLVARLQTYGDSAQEAVNFVKNDGAFKQQLVADIREQAPLDAEDKKKRNAVQELYFGISILMMALAFALLLLLPVYAYLKLAKNFHGYDDVERRDWLYALVFSGNVLMGHLFGSRLLASTPTVFFLAPFIYALLIDVELCPKTVYCNRPRLLAAASVISFVVMQALSFMTGMHGVVSSLAILFQCMLMAIHFQLVMGNTGLAKGEKEKIAVSEAQILYVAAVLVFQLPVSLFCSSSA
uniref:Uncharacterized protein n=1 Tax=Ditylenchus dipsaci TaxID=166011 RepID=A0A915CZE8_9BILA